MLMVFLVMRVASLVQCQLKIDKFFIFCLSPHNIKKTDPKNKQTYITQTQTQKWQLNGEKPKSLLL